MPIGSPFYKRQLDLNTAMRWKDWAGYLAPCSFDVSHDREYFALRHSTGLIDVTPLYKYLVHGRDAATFLSLIMGRNVAKLKEHQVTYTCWCNHEGKILDDGTITRLDATSFRVTAAEPSYAWFASHKGRLEVSIDDTTDATAALAVQGPTSRALLQAVFPEAGDLFAGLRFFRHAWVQDSALPASRRLEVTRTGYTGDLGFELWIHPDDALQIWDRLWDVGQRFGICAVGLDALDVSRVEAGFLMNGVDYYSANRCPIESRKSTPLELGLGWTLDLDRPSFLGQSALLRERTAGSAWQQVGLAMDWVELEALYNAHGLPPQLPAGVNRSPLPIYSVDGEQIGHATSSVWSPTLKTYIALATLSSAALDSCRRPGQDVELRLEHTVEYRRQSIRARKVTTPFLDPLRKRSQEVRYATEV